MKLLKILCVLTFLLCYSLNVFSQTSLNDNAQKLRDILKPYFVPIEYDDHFLINEKAKIDLGRSLFYDENLSANSRISCNSCHDLLNYGTNGSYFFSEKKNGSFYRDVPSIYNSGTLSMYNADGGMSSLEEKLIHSFLSPHEMGMTSKSEVITRIKKDSNYKALFEKAFPDGSNPIVFDNLITSLKVFIKGLVTPAPVDAFIKGDDKALSKEQIEGGLIFNSKSCYSCHTGSNIGGQMIQKLGLNQDWPNQTDLGYYDVKKQSAYKMFFRVASLRNVEHTSPYFHDASSNTLWESIITMGKYERDLVISKQEALKIEQFLVTLSGKIPHAYIKRTSRL